MNNPITIGDIVKVVSPTDETMDVDCIGKFGRVIQLDIGARGSVCGESATDPYIHVILPGFGGGTFWTEELERLPQGMDETAMIRANRVFARSIAAKVKFFNYFAQVNIQLGER
jgi:hypothetical protein